MEYEVLHSLIFSLARIWIAFAAMLVVSILLGVYLVFISKRESSYMLLFQIIASIPATILLPLIALSFKDSGELVAFIIFFLSGLWYVLFSIVSNKTAIQSSVMEVKKIFGVKGESSWKYIYIRALLPGIITGSITAIAAEWNASIVAEYFTKSGISGTSVITQVQWGLGKLLDVSLGNGNLALMILGLINLTILIIIVNRLLWKRLYRNVMNVYK
jgi:NitT/TauT family transport system permease protein